MEKNVVLVCQLCREVGEAPRSWAWVVLWMTRENMSNMTERLNTKRMRTVRELCGDGWVGGVRGGGAGSGKVPVQWLRLMG